MKTELLHYNAFMAALAKAASVDEVKAIHDKAAAIKAAAKVLKDREAVANMAVVRAKAERRLGEMLEQGKADRAGRGKPKNISEKCFKLPMSQEDFDSHIAEEREMILEGSYDRIHYPESKELKAERLAADREDRKREKERKAKRRAEQSGKAPRLCSPKRRSTRSTASPLPAAHTIRPANGYRHCGSLALSKPAPEAAALLAARRAAAKELKLPVHDWRVKRYALLMVAHDAVTAAAGTGAGYDINDLLKLDGAMQEIRATLPPERVKVDIKFIGREDFTCRHCGKDNAAEVYHGKQALREAAKHDAVVKEEVPARVTAPAAAIAPPPATNVSSNKPTQAEPP